jgi:hypothetical protein
MASENGMRLNLKQLINDTVIGDAKYINQKVVLISKWHLFYGHLIDTLTVLADFFYRHRLNELGYKVMLQVPLDIPEFANILEIAKTLLGSHFENLIDLEEPQRLLQFREVILIHHSTISKSFLSLPQSVTNILQTQWDNGIDSPWNNVFISRSTRNTIRVLKNHVEVEDFFRRHGFFVINPEPFSNRELYNIVKGAKNIVITNGSALSSLIFLHISSRIFCLNSRGYQPSWRHGIASEKELPPDADQREDFEKRIWKNAVSRFNFTYVDAYLNRITDEQLDEVMQSLKS